MARRNKRGQFVSQKQRRSTKKPATSPGFFARARAGVASGARNVYSFVAPRLRKAAQDNYRMGIVPKTSWGLWLARQFAQPLLGSKTMGLKGAIPAWEEAQKAGKTFGESLQEAYTEFDDAFSIRTGGYKPSTATWISHPLAFATIKEMVSPALTTGVDWGFSRIIGTAGRKLKIWKLQLIGSK